MPSFPSFEERFASGEYAVLTFEASRIFWTLEGPLGSAISVMSIGWPHSGPDQREPYVQGRTLADGGAATTTTLHPVAAAPLTEPKIGAVTVSVYSLERWEEDWMEHHEGEAYPDNPDCVFGRLPPDYEGDEGDEESDEELLRCCGQDRPTKKWRLTVEATNPDAGFVTVHDYVSAVHPWLLSLRDKIVEADNVWENNPPEYYNELGVSHTRPDHLLVDGGGYYVAGLRSRGQNRPPVPGAPSYLEQLVAKAEGGDVEAVAQAMHQAAIQNVPHGLSPKAIQTLRDKYYREMEEDYEKEVQQYASKCSDASPEELELEIRHYKSLIEDSYASRRDWISKMVIT